MLEKTLESPSDSKEIKLVNPKGNPTPGYPMDYIVQGILQARILQWVAVPSPGDLPNPGIEPRSSALQVDSLSAEPQESPRILEWVAHPSPSDHSDSGIKPGSPALQANSLPTELPGKQVKEINPEYSLEGLMLKLKLQYIGCFM